MAEPGRAETGRGPKTGRRVLAALLTLVALGILVGFLIDQRAHIAAQYAASPGALVGIAGAIVVTLVVRSFANRVLFRRLGIQASAADWMRVVTVSSFTNYLPLSAGMVAKAYFLKRVHALPYGSFAVGQMALLVMIVSTNGAVGLVTLATALPDHLAGPLGAGFALMLSAMAALLLPVPILRTWAGRSRWWDADALPALRRAWPEVALWQLANLLATAVALRIAFSLGRAEVGLAPCLVFSAAAMLTRLVAITPGAIGIREFLVGGMAYWTGFELRDAVIASTVTRTVEVAVVFALGGAFTYRFSHQISASYAEPEER